MNFGIFIPFLFLICEISFYLVTGQSTNEEGKNDCTKFLNFVNSDNKTYTDLDCCSNNEIMRCEDGYITYMEA